MTTPDSPGYLHVFTHRAADLQVDILVTEGGPAGGSADVAQPCDEEVAVEQPTARKLFDDGTFQSAALDLSPMLATHHKNAGWLLHALPRY